MNRQQKIAWFTIVVLALSLLFSIAVVFWLWLVQKAEFRIALGGFGFLCVCLFHALGPIVFRKKHRPREALFDERDIQISQRANFYSNIASNVCFVSIFVSYCIRKRNHITIFLKIVILVLH